MREATYNLGRLLPVAEGRQGARPYPARLGFASGLGPPPSSIGEEVLHAFHSGGTANYCIERARGFDYRHRFPSRYLE
jgi:hypothetical protein